MRAGSRELLVRQVRDLPLVDRRDHACGVADQVEVAEIEPGVWEVTAILVGLGAWSLRRPQWLMRIFHGAAVRVSASDIASVTSVVRLARNAEELGLARIERRLLAHR